MHHSSTLAVVLSLFTAASASAQTPSSYTAQSARDWVLRAGSTVNPLRLLAEDAHIYEYPTGGMTVRVGSQFTQVDVQNEDTTVSSDFLNRQNLAVALGTEDFKLVIVADQVAISPKFTWVGNDSSQLAYKAGVVIGLPITFAEEFVLMPAISQASYKEGTKTTADAIVPMLRARLFGEKLQWGRNTDEKGIGTILNALAPFEMLSAFSPETSRSLARFGNPELLTEHYDKGSSPFSLDPATSKAGTDYGLRWNSPRVLRNVFLSAEGTVGSRNGSTTWKRGEASLHAVIPIYDHRIIGGLTSNAPWKMMIPFVPFVSELLGLWSPGVTLLTVSGRAFAMNMDDKSRWGYVAKVRIGCLSNNDRLNSEGRNEMSDISLWYEGEDAERVQVYLDFVVSRNDLYSTRGLPVPDITTYGIFFGSDDLDFDPTYPEVARVERDAFNRHLDGNPNYKPDSKRKYSDEELDEAERQKALSTDRNSW